MTWECASATDCDAILLGLEAGVDDFLTKPFDSLEIQIKVKNILKLNRFRSLIDQRNDLIRANEELVITYDKTIEGWSNALDLREHETEGHSLRVVETSLKLARLAGISETELVHFRRGALMHDIGNLGIPDAILLKPGKLTDEEWTIMRMHPVYAYEGYQKSITCCLQLIFPIATMKDGMAQGIRAG